MRPIGASCDKKATTVVKTRVRVCCKKELKFLTSFITVSMTCGETISHISIIPTITPIMADIIPIN